MVTDTPVSGAGTLGFVISGRLTRADYQDVLLPPIRDAIERGEQIRVLAVIDDFRGVEAGGLLEELRAAAKLGSGQRGPTPHFAVVTGTDWVRRSIVVFGRFVPGKVRVFTSAQRAEAEAWLARAA